MTPVLTLALVFVGVIVVAIALRTLVGLLISWFGPNHEQIVSEYEKDFPGSCGVCAFHGFAVRQGWEDVGSVPPDHRCPERLQRFKGALHSRQG